MLELTFGEQVKIVLSRKGMTIKELAQLIELQTGKKMSRQNLTQRLSRDNFQEQDMRMIAGILECPLHLSILDEEVQTGKAPARVHKQRAAARPAVSSRERDITVGEILDIHKRLDELEEDVREKHGAAESDAEAEPQDSYTVDELLAEVDALESEAREGRGTAAPGTEEKPHGLMAYLQRNKRTEEPAVEPGEYGQARYEPENFGQESYEPENGEEYEMYNGEEAGDDGEIFGSGYEPDEELYIANEGIFEDDEDTELGDVNPYTGREYKTNSVRMHPDRIGYVQVYDRADHRWTDMTEWAFLGYQERKKALLGKDYVPPVYLD